MRDWSAGKSLYNRITRRNSLHSLLAPARPWIQHATFFWITTLILIAGSMQIAAQPAGYYDTAEGLSGEQLQQVLHDIIDDHTVLSYSALWTAVRTTDDRDDGTVWDMYSDVPDGPEPYVYVFGEDQCGNYSGEGSCYNREHSFPKSWFNDASPMYTDLFHLYPTDGYVNGRRGNYPFGETDQATWTSLNGSEVGPCSVNGYSGTVFEPIDAYKGDFARTYFYMSVRYYGEDAGWAGSPMVDGAQMKPWAREMLVSWHMEDPVSEKERERNDAIYGYQGNRNPFIDHPEFVDRMYGGGNLDELAPVLDSVTILSAGEIRLWFNEPLDSLTAADPSNYSISGSVTVSSASYAGATNTDVFLTVSDLENGSYSIVISGVADTAGNALQGAFFYFQVSTLSGSIPEISTRVKVFPNPGDGLFFLDTDPGIVVRQVRLTDLTGKTLDVITRFTPGEALDFSGWPSGIYLLHMEFASHAPTTIRLIIEPDSFGL